MRKTLPAERAILEEILEGTVSTYNAINMRLDLVARNATILLKHNSGLRCKLFVQDMVIPGPGHAPRAFWYRTIKHLRHSR